MSAILWPVRSEDLARTTPALQYVLRVTCNAVTSNLNFPVAAMTAGRNYFFAGDAQADADGGVGGVGDLVALLQATLRTHAQGASFAVTISATNRLTITCSNSFSLLWSNGSTTLLASPFGFPQTDSTPGTSLVAALQTRGAWTPLRPPSTDTRDQRQRTIVAATALSGRSRAGLVCEGLATRDLTYQLLARRYARQEYADASEPTGTAEDMWVNALSLGRVVRYYSDEAVRSSVSYGPYKVRPDEVDLGDFSKFVQREGSQSAQHVFWQLALPLRRAA